MTLLEAIGWIILWFAAIAVYQFARHFWRGFMLTYRPTVDSVLNVDDDVYIGTVEGAPFSLKPGQSVQVHTQRGTVHVQLRGDLVVRARFVREAKT